MTLDNLVPYGPLHLNQVIMTKSHGTSIMAFGFRGSALNVQRSAGTSLNMMA